MKTRYLRTSLLLTFLFNSYILLAQYPAGSPVAKYGRLKVVGTQLSSECGDAVQLRGMSTHGLQWFESCLTPGSLDALTKDWKTDIMRLAMYVQENGYLNDPAKWKVYIDNMVDECGKRGIYCLIDWHVMTPGDPNSAITESIDFWQYMALKHGTKKHVLYEICNEPNGVGWDVIKNYANNIIPKIRAIDPNTVIMVGTADYSSKPGDAATSKLNYSNLLYSLHFYSASHGQSYRDQGNKAIQNGVGVFVTEFGTTKATGDDGPNIGATDEWMRWMDEKKISWCNWSFCDKDEDAAALAPGSCAKASWNNTSASGSYIKGKILAKGSFRDCGGNTPPPVAELTAPLNFASFVTPSDIVLEATASSPSGTISKVDFYAGDKLLGSDNSAPYTYTWSGAAVGTYAIKAIATSSTGITGNSSSTNIFVNVPTSPYKGTPAMIPGKTEAEDYDLGGNNNAYFDSNIGNAGAKYRTDDVDIETTTDAGAGSSLGFTAAGEWLKYSVDVVSTGLYSFHIRVASNESGRKIHLEMDNKNITGNINVPNTGGWQTWQTVTVNDIPLEQGPHVLKLVFDTDGANVNYVETKLLKITGLFGNDQLVSGLAENIYPNPSTNSFYLKLNQQVKKMTLTNLVGATVVTDYDIAGGQIYELGKGLEEGTYFLQLEYVTGKSEMYRLLKVK